MKPEISKTGFGYVEIEGSRINHDILIRTTGEIHKRKKKLSKAVYGTSHKLSSDEAKYIYQESAECLIIGSGQYGALAVSEGALDFFKQKKCRVIIQPTPEAIQTWNKSEGKTIALFHVNC